MITQKIYVAQLITYTEKQQTVNYLFKVTGIFH
uniref:Uncharacterized protein n=1 Tax=Anguilla anguilla TaxID=7936 RepID=A0A0E9QF17_ANGAN